MADELKYDGSEEVPDEVDLEGAGPADREATAGEPQDASGSEEPDLGEDGDDGDGPETGPGEFDDDLFGGAGSLASYNRGVFGTVTLHYPERDVPVVLDGENALRLLSMFAERRHGPSDRLDSESSTAFAGWLVLDLDEVRAMSWWPSIGSRPSRTVIDPPLPQQA